jgi:hypothetical protein
MKFSAANEYLSVLFAGDLGPFGGPSPDSATAGQIRSEQMKAILRSAPGMMIATASNATVLAIALWGSPDQWLALSWSSAMVVAAFFLSLK